MSVRIVPSILSADFARLGEQIATVVAGGADWIHIDVMDGRFVPNITYGAKVIETVRKLTTLPLDVHLMVVEPEKFFDDFASAGANGMTVHTEVSPHLHRQLDRIRELGCRAGAAINPSTPLSAVREVIPELDLLLVMTVNPGFGAQKFIPYSVEKVRRARAMLTEARSGAALEVDGGIGRDTIHACGTRAPTRSSRATRSFARAIRRPRSARCAALCGVTRMTARKQWTIVGAIVVVLAAGLAVTSHFLRDQLFPVTEGSDAPNFRAKVLGENRYKTLADYKGQVVLLNIWATWCGPCQVEIPSLQRLYRRTATRASSSSP